MPGDLLYGTENQKTEGLGTRHGSSTNMEPNIFIDRSSRPDHGDHRYQFYGSARRRLPARAEFREFSNGAGTVELELE